MSAYAYLCTECHHLAAGHRLVEGGELIAGPYCCNLCPCRSTQTSGTVPLSHSQYMRLPARVRKAAAA